MHIKIGGTVRIAHGPPSNGVLGRPRTSTSAAKPLEISENLNKKAPSFAPRASSLGN
jgi:hypothetical protein